MIKFFSSKHAVLQAMVATIETNIPFNTLVVTLPNALGQAYTSPPSSDAKDNGEKPVAPGNLAKMNNYRSIDLGLSDKLLLNNKKSNSKLQGTLTAIGMCSDGHWWTLTFDGQEIYKHDDSKITKIDEKKAKDEISKFASYLVYNISEVNN